MGTAEVVEYEGVKVRVKPRSDGRTVLYWREAGKGRSTTYKKKADAMKEALSLAKQLARGQGGLVVTHEQAQIVTKVLALAGTQSPFLWLSQIEACQAKLKGASIAQATNHFVAGGMLSLVRVPFPVARERFMKRYDKSGIYTKGSMRRTLLAFERAHGDFDVLDFTADLLQEWIEKVAVAETTFNAQLGYWKTFLGSCREWKYLPKGEKTAAELISKKREPDRIPPIFRPAEAQAIVDALPMDLMPAFVIGAWMGTRPLAELRKMEWRYFDWERGYYELTTQAAGKTMRARFIPIPENVKAMLAPWREAQGRCVRHSDSWKLCKFITEHALLPPETGGVWPPDILRHSSISYMLADGVSISVTAERHGNSETIIRKKYRRPLRKEDAVAWYGIVRRAEG